MRSNAKMLNWALNRKSLHELTCLLSLPASRAAFAAWIYAFTRSLNGLRKETRSCHQTAPPAGGLVEKTL